MSFGSVCSTHNGDGCGREYKGNQLQIDHIIPRAFGGTGDITNKQLLCRKCHAKKNTWYNIAMNANKFIRNSYLIQ